MDFSCISRLARLIESGVKEGQVFGYGEVWAAVSVDGVFRFYAIIEAPCVTDISHIYGRMD